MPACRRRRDESEETKPDTIHKTLCMAGEKAGRGKRGRGARGGLALGNGRLEKLAGVMAVHLM